MECMGEDGSYVLIQIQGYLVCVCKLENHLRSFPSTVFETGFHHSMC